MNQNQQDIDENLLLQYLLGNADDTVRDMVGKWIDADSRNRKHLDQLETLWLETGKLNPPPLPVDLPKARERLEARIKKQEDEQVAQQKKLLGRRYLLYAMSAAALVLLVFGIYAILRLQTTKVNEIEIAANASVISDTLPDGSLITLNKQSKLKYPEQFKDGKRIVILTGEAFFKVTKNPLKPFVVDAGIAKVKVLGTVFNVSAYPGKDIRVKVNEGRVLFFTLDPGNRDTLSILLTAGMSGILKQGALKPEVVEKSAPDKLFWANRTLDFNGTPLSVVFELVEKYYGVKISASTPDILNCRLTASFVDEPVGRINTVIAESLELKLSVDGNNYYYSGNGCNKENN
ncbi:MAG: FecR domain-containing protein, partial [Bacteroidota bacterium]